MAVKTITAMYPLGHPILIVVNCMINICRFIASHVHVYVHFVIYSLFMVSITMVWWIALTDMCARAYPEPHIVFSKTHLQVQIIENIIQ